MRKLTAIAAFMTLVLLPLAVVSSPAAAAPPRAVFNTPRPYAGNAANFRIVNRVERTIKAMPRHKRGKPRPVITIATYLLDRTTTVTQLIRACKRGVAVRVIIDEGIQNRNSRRLINTLNGDNVRDRNHDGKPDRKPKRRPCNRPLHRKAGSSHRTDSTEQDDGKMSRREVSRSVKRPMRASVTWGRDSSYVKRCRPSCRSGRGNMHTKMFLFSRGRVVMVSSSNLNRGGAKLGWNDMYIIRHRPKSYGAYVRQHRAMTAGKPAPRRRIQITDGPYTTRFFPIRGAGIKKDPVMSDLRRVKCRSALGRTRLHISMFFWKGRRGNYITTKLLNLARAGCRVNIIYGAPSRQMAARLRNAARVHLIRLYDSRFDRNKDGFVEVRTHSKYIAIRGNYGGDRKNWIVMTGSPNWVAGSLSKGDESSLNIRLKSAYNAYLRNWETVRRHSRKVPFS